ncbi:MAG: hypothetical protein D6803_05395, partial [Anaerolineae bacterium]
MKPAHLIYNPAAGRFPSRLLIERAAHVLRAQGWDIELMVAHNGEHIAHLSRAAAEAGAETVFIAGGDGSINYALRGLLGSETALAVLPAGTANVWAQEIGLPALGWTRWMALEESARRYRQARLYRMDVGFCNQYPFLLWGGVGLDAFTVHRMEPRKRWEKQFAVAQYAATVVQQAYTVGGLDLQVLTDSEQIRGRFLLAVASNIHLYAGGIAEISPSARLDDGEMDLWLFAGDSLLEALNHAWALWSGKHVHSEHARCIPFRELRLRSTAPLYVQVDGEPVTGDEEIHLRVEKQAISVLIPP